MSFATPATPNLPDFILFVQNGMMIPATALPSDSPWLGYAFNRAVNLVINIPAVAGSDYTVAVYNCAGHILLGIAPDQPGQGYFTAARESFDLLEASSGVIASSADQGTANSFAVPEVLNKMTIGDLYFFKTPYGREYLAFAQSFGDIAGLT